MELVADRRSGFTEYQNKCTSSISIGQKMTYTNLYVGTAQIGGWSHLIGRIADDLGVNGLETITSYMSASLDVSANKIYGASFKLPTSSETTTGSLPANLTLNTLRTISPTIQPTSSMPIQPSSNMAQRSPTFISTRAAVGIGVGCFLGAFTLCFILWVVLYRRRKLKAPRLSHGTWPSLAVLGTAEYRKELDGRDVRFEIGGRDARAELVSDPKEIVYELESWERAQEMPSVMGMKECVSPL
ncbi:hypothetical protein BJ875DRAFT_442332 [Amylocarpus encephaloides]|uniref:Uncharacterized protein n=1 Tax=Amylocarpus encephaloides TaxID=45428 RepID=A0A9P8C476_9HELO|nr:hypothetical protein BJ875DRAFT_442332 [Amylocarpus encephaloides]